MKKRMLCVLLVLCLAVSAIPFAAAAEEKAPGVYWTDVTYSEMTTVAEAVFNGTEKEDVILMFTSANCSFCHQYTPIFRQYANENHIRVLCYTYSPNSADSNYNAICSSMYHFFPSGSFGWPAGVAYRADTRLYKAQDALRSEKAFMQLASFVRPADQQTPQPTEEPTEPATQPPATENPFTDVKPGAYYYDAVLWALNSHVTNGVTATEFRPNADCTRAQTVTFLWRAMGSPAPKGSNNPFTDVKKSDYFYKAVLWAVENDITQGMTATTFNPSGACTRAHVVTFLWRAEGRPKPKSSKNPFTDVPSGKYYTEAVLWAVENGVTNGMTKTTFCPTRTCTRGQIVTFLYRDLAQ